MQVTTTLLVGASGQGPVPGEVRCTHNWRPTCTTDDLTAGIDRPKVVYQQQRIVGMGGPNCLFTQLP